MYGLIGQLRAVPGERDALIAVFAAMDIAMPGCASYVVAEDREDPDAIWITEVWHDQTSHEASLQLAQVREAIEAARPLIAGFGARYETTPVAGTRTTT